MNFHFVLRVYDVICLLLPGKDGFNVVEKCRSGEKKSPKLVLPPRRSCLTPLVEQLGWRCIYFVLLSTFDLSDSKERKHENEWLDNRERWRDKAETRRLPDTRFCFHCMIKPCSQISALTTLCPWKLIMGTWTSSMPMAENNTEEEAIINLKKWVGELHVIFFLFPYQIVMSSSECTIDLIHIIWFICNSRKNKKNNDNIISMQEEKQVARGNWSFYLLSVDVVFIDARSAFFIFFAEGSMSLWTDEKKEGF